MINTLKKEEKPKFLGLKFQGLTLQCLLFVFLLSILFFSQPVEVKALKTGGYASEADDCHTGDIGGSGVAASGGEGDSLSVSASNSNTGKKESATFTCAGGAWVQSDNPDGVFGKSTINYSFTNYGGGVSGFGGTSISFRSYILYGGGGLPPSPQPIVPCFVNQGDHVEVGEAATEEWEAEVVIGPVYGAYPRGIFPIDYWVSESVNGGEFRTVKKTAANFKEYFDEFLHPYGVISNSNFGSSQNRDAVIWLRNIADLGIVVENMDANYGGVYRWDPESFSSESFIQGWVLPSILQNMGYVGASFFGLISAGYRGDLSAFCRFREKRYDTVVDPTTVEFGPWSGWNFFRIKADHLAPPQTTQKITFNKEEVVNLFTEVIFTDSCSIYAETPFPPRRWEKTGSFSMMQGTSETGEETISIPPLSQRPFYNPFGGGGSSIIPLRFACTTKQGFKNKLLDYLFWGRLGDFAVLPNPQPDAFTRKESVLALYQADSNDPSLSSSEKAWAEIYFFVDDYVNNMDRIWEFNNDPSQFNHIAIVKTNVFVANHAPQLMISNLLPISNVVAGDIIERSLIDFYNLDANNTGYVVKNWTQPEPLTFETIKEIVAGKYIFKFFKDRLKIPVFLMQVRMAGNFDALIAVTELVENVLHYLTVQFSQSGQNWVYDINAWDSSNLAEFNKWIDEMNALWSQYFPNSRFYNSSKFPMSFLDGPEITMILNNLPQHSTTGSLKFITIDPPKPDFSSEEIFWTDVPPGVKNFEARISELADAGLEEVGSETSGIYSSEPFYGNLYIGDRALSNIGTKTTIEGRTTGGIFQNQDQGFIPLKQRIYLVPSARSILFPFLNPETKYFYSILAKNQEGEPFCEYKGVIPPQRGLVPECVDGRSVVGFYEKGETLRGQPGLCPPGETEITPIPDDGAVSIINPQLDNKIKNTNQPDLISKISSFFGKIVQAQEKAPDHFLVPLLYEELQAFRAATVSREELPLRTARDKQICSDNGYAVCGCAEGWTPFDPQIEQVQIRDFYNSGIEGRPISISAFDKEIIANREAFMGKIADLTRIKVGKKGKFFKNLFMSGKVKNAEEKNVDGMANLTDLLAPMSLLIGFDFYECSSEGGSLKNCFAILK